MSLKFSRTVLQSFLYVVLLAGAPALAQTAPDPAPIPPSTTGQGNTSNIVEKAWVAAPARSATTAAATGVEDFRKGLPGPVSSSSDVPGIHCSAKTLIGLNVQDTRNEMVATIKDVILDQYGNPKKVVLIGNGSVGDNGRLVALDFKDVIDNSGTAPSLVKPISDDVLKNAPAFSGIRDSDNIAASQVVTAAVKNDSGASMGFVQNVVFDPQTEPYLIVSYVQGQASGTALLRYKDLQEIDTTNSVSFAMTKAQADFFTATVLGTK